MNSKKIILKSTSLEFLLICFLTYYYLIPVASESISYLFILGIEIVYSIYIFRRSDRNMKNAFLIYVILIFAVTFCYYFFTITKSVNINVENYDAKRFLSKFNQLITFFAPILFFYRINRIGTLKQKKLLVIFSFVLFSYVIIKSYNYFITSDENLARMWEMFEDLEAENIATYSYVYTASAMIPLLFSVFLRIKKQWKKTFLLAYILFLCMFLFSAQYTLSIIIAIIGIVLAILLGAKKHTRIFMTFVMPIIVLLLPNILEKISSSITSEVIGTRFLDIAMFFGGKKGTGDTLLGRLELYKLCIKAFLKSPIWGNKFVTFDGHSTFLTALCDVGLLGSVPLYYIYFKIPNIIKNILSNNIVKTMYVPVFTSLIIMGFTNPIHASYSLGFATCFVAPLIISFFTNEQIEK